MILSYSAPIYDGKDLQQEGFEASTKFSSYTHRVNGSRGCLVRCHGIRTGFEPWPGRVVYVVLLENTILLVYSTSGRYGTTSNESCKIRTLS